MNAPTWLATSKSRIIALAVVLLLLAGVALAYVVFWANPPTPWVVKLQINRYLKAESRKTDFRVDFPFPSAEEMRRKPADEGSRPEAVKGALTGKPFFVLREEYLDRQTELLVLQREVEEHQAELRRRPAQIAAAEKKLAATERRTGDTNRTILSSNLVFLQSSVPALEREIPVKQEKIVAHEQSLVPIRSDLLDMQRRWAAEQSPAGQRATDSLSQAQAKFLDTTENTMEQAPTYAAIYHLIGQELWVASQLFTSRHPAHQRVALNIARKARRDAEDFAVDAWLAARICEAYVRPHLDLAETFDRRSRINYESLADECARAFRDAEEPHNVIALYRWIIKGADQPRRADWARVQVAEMRMREGDFKDAITYLKQVQLTNDFAWALRRLPWLEQRAKNQ